MASLGVCDGAEDRDGLLSAKRRGAERGGEEENEANGQPPTVAEQAMTLVLDVLASVIFWYIMLFVPCPDPVFYGLAAALASAMLVWRLYRAYWAPVSCTAEVPYTCGFAAVAGKELFLVATLHISPRAPRDVHAVIEGTRPDVAMIELDEERLDRMRPPEEGPAPEAKREDLQPLTVTAENGTKSTLYAQRAVWNAEWTGEVVSGRLVHEEANAHGLLPPASPLARGGVLLVRRGSPDGSFAPFALKAQRAFSGGATAVVVFTLEPTCPLPAHRVGGASSVRDDLRLWWSTWSCGFPPVPVLLVGHEDGQRMLEACKQDPSGAGPRVEFQVLADDKPRRTLRRRLCQGCALMMSGIGILYMVIQCFAVEVGGEFLQAETSALACGIPCVCVDVDLNSFWSRLGAALIPTPCNLLHALLSWLAFPRVLFRVLFPPTGSVDVMGSMVLHALSFSCKTWFAFALAGFAASTVTTKVLELLSFGAEQGAEEAGAVSSDDRDVVTSLIMTAVQLYVMPQAYDAIAASRDEAMYRSVAAKTKEFAARRVVVVVGAGHANGILRRARERGF